MLCPLCSLDMAVMNVRNELVSLTPPAVELVQTLLCPKCGKTQELRHPLPLTIIR